jgi:dolichol-phosphate mannosyltransferase
MVQPELSFVIPAYNEERFIEDTLGKLDLVIKDKRLQYEVVVVDDGSQDTTYTKAKKYAKKNAHVRVLHFSRNTGKGNAVRTGSMESVGDIVVFVDSDMEIDLKTITSYVEALDRGDIVIASKWHPKSDVHVPLVRKILSRTFNVFVKILTKATLKDTQVGLKVMKRSAVDTVFPRLAVKRYAFDVELLAVANLYGLKVVEMPVTLKLDAPFKVKEALRMFIDLLGIAYRLRVIHWYQHEVPVRDSLQHLVSAVLRET